MNKSKNISRKHSDFFVQNKIETEHANLVGQVDNRQYSPISSSLLYGKSNQLVRTINQSGQPIGKITPKSNNLYHVSQRISFRSKMNDEEQKGSENGESQETSNKHIGKTGFDSDVNTLRKIESEIFDNKRVSDDEGKKMTTFQSDFFTGGSERAFSNYFSKGPNMNSKLLFLII